MYNPNQPLAEGNTLIVSLSTEELSLIVAAMHVPKFVGFRPPTDMPVAAAQAAERSLRLRGMAGVSPDGKFIVDVNLARLISVCAVPTHMLVVRQDFSRVEGYFTKPYENRLVPRLHFIGVHGSDMVYHNRATPGMHSFSVITNAEMLKIVLSATLQIPKLDSVPDAADATYKVDHASLLNAEGLHKTGGGEAVYDRMINDLNAPPSLARAIASRKKHLLGVVWRNDWEEPGYAYTEDTLVHSNGFVVVPAEEGGVWAYHVDGDNPKMAIFQPASAAMLVDEMVNRLHTQMGIA
jgi:hypothetical protein